MPDTTPKSQHAFRHTYMDAQMGAPSCCPTWQACHFLHRRQQFGLIRPLDLHIRVSLPNTDGNKPKNKSCFAFEQRRRRLWAALKLLSAPARHTCAGSHVRMHGRTQPDVHALTQACMSARIHKRTRVHTCSSPQTSPNTGTLFTGPTVTGACVKRPHGCCRTHTSPPSCAAC